MADRPGQGLWHPAAALPLLLILGPYYANKFVYLAYPGDYLVFLATDYANKILTLTALWLVLRRTPVRLAIPWRFEIGTARTWALAIATTAILVALEVAANPGEAWLNELTGRLTRYPAATGHPVLEIVDDTFGCLLTGVAEEAVFRFYLLNVLLLRGLSMRSALVVSTILFAAIHWSYGGGNVAFAAVAAVPLALIYVSTRNLAVPAIAHAADDALFFAGATDLLEQLVR